MARPMPSLVYDFSVVAFSDGKAESTHTRRSSGVYSRLRGLRCKRLDAPSRGQAFPENALIQRAAGQPGQFPRHPVRWLSGNGQLAFALEFFDGRAGIGIDDAG